ncbi:hypothetical protein PR001_g14930 [Phytophthora rubi]|nr:hypothetical protein PR001_g14930 [Phytophthora rubi]
MGHALFLSAGAALIFVCRSMQLFCLDAATKRVTSCLSRSALQLVSVSHCRYSPHCGGVDQLAGCQGFTGA